MRAQIWNKSGWISETDPEILAAAFEYRLKTAGFNIVGEIEHHFTPYGYTKLWLLAESHLAVHTFPEEGRTYVEISSCNEDKYNAFISTVNMG